MIRPWRTLRSEPLGDYTIFRLRRDYNESPTTGRTHVFHVLESPDWINIIPVTHEGRVVLIRQYRNGTAEIGLEIPGGLADLDGESMADAARRELIEETGYDSDGLVCLGHLAPNPAVQDNRVHTFLAPNARRIGPQDLKGAEEIDVELYDLDDIPDLIRTGQINHAIVVSAFYLFDQYRKTHAFNV